VVYWMKKICKVVALSPENYSLPFDLV